jgi:hypothetical protein
VLCGRGKLGNKPNLRTPQRRIFQGVSGANKRFWGPDSWKNKYNDFDPVNGRNGTPIWFTDGKHLTASATQVLVFGAGLSIGIGERRKWWMYAADIGISFAAYSFGFDIFWR